MNIENDERVIEFFINREIRGSTRTQYLRYLKYYCHTTETPTNPPLTPTELINEAIEDYKTGAHPGELKIRKRLLIFKKWLLEQPYSDLSRKKGLGLIKTFYREFEITLPNITIKTKSPPLLRIEDLPGKEDIHKIYARANTRYQAIILLMASSGMARIDTLNLKYTDFLKSVEGTYKPPINERFDIGVLAEILGENDVIPVWQRVRAKTRIPFLTFSSPESTRAILTYLLSDPPKQLNDFLFRIHGQRIKETSFKQYFARMNDLSGFGMTGKYRFLSSHNLRRRFGSILIDEDVDYVKAEYMLGHSLPQTQGAYFKMPSVESMKEAYLKALPALSIIDDVETVIITDERIKSLESDNQELLEEVRMMREWIEAKDKLEAVRKKKFND